MVELPHGKEAGTSSDDRVADDLGDASEEGSDEAPSKTGTER